MITRKQSIWHQWIKFYNAPRNKQKGFEYK
jgi:hypothetical protein